MYTHEIWLWFWFFCGMGMYMLKRAYYLVTGPNPIANNYWQFMERCWVPLLIRAFLDSLLFWAMFTPGVMDSALSYLGWSSAAGSVAMVTKFAFAAALFGHVVDSVMDFIVSKVPYAKDMLPQMPGPLRTAAPTEAQVEAQKEIPPPGEPPVQPPLKGGK